MTRNNITHWWHGDIKPWVAVTCIQLLGFFLVIALATLSIMIFNGLAGGIFRFGLIALFGVYSTVVVLRSAKKFSREPKLRLLQAWTIFFDLYVLLVASHELAQGL